MYSDTLSNPKNAHTIAAQIIILSSYLVEELNKLNLIVRNKSGVTGKRFGFLNLLPWDFLMPRRTKYNLLNVSKV